MEELNLKKCTICLEDILTDIEFLPCTHSFHRECINGWLSTKPLCPMCQIPVFVSSPQQLELYNHYKNIRERHAEQESRFFQQVSAGAYDNNSNDEQNQPEAEISGAPQNILATLADAGGGVLFRRIPNSIENSISQVTYVNNIMNLFDLIINNAYSPENQNEHNETQENTNSPNSN